MKNKEYVKIIYQIDDKWKQLYKSFEKYIYNFQEFYTLYFIYWFESNFYLCINSFFYYTCFKKVIRLYDKKEKNKNKRNLNEIHVDLNTIIEFASKKYYIKKRLFQIIKRNIFQNLLIFYCKF